MNAIGMYSLMEYDPEFDRPALKHWFDLPEIRESQEIPDEFSTDRFVAMFEEFSSDIWMIRKDDERIGLVAAIKQKDGFYQLPIFIVDPSLRGKGIGRWALMQVVRKAEMDRIDLVQKILPENHAMLRLSEKCGFKKICVEDGHIRLERKCQ